MHAERLTNWDDLKLVIAMARHGAMAPAAQSLGLNVTTVFRRLKALEARTGAPLFERSANLYQATELGRAVLAIAERTDNELVELERRLSSGDPLLGGVVRLTTARDIASVLVIPMLADFKRKHPSISVELSSEDRLLDLMRREADMAIRPTSKPPESMIGIKVGPIAITAYATADLVKRVARAGIASLPWIGWNANLGPSRDREFLEQHISEEHITFRCNDFRDQLAAARTGIGAALLPCFLGDPEPKLRRLMDPPAELITDLWIMSHPDLRRSPRVRLLSDHLYQQFKPLRDLLAGRRRAATK
jgi:DNA-binding transcriptional LysR family regulator